MERVRCKMTSQEDETDPLLKQPEKTERCLTASFPHSYSYDEATYKTRKRRYWRNLWMLSLSFTFVFSAYLSLQNLQSTLNQSAGVGVISMSVLYACVASGCLVAPLVNEKLGSKWTIVLSQAPFLAFVGANFYPRFYTLVPVSALIGLSAAFLWTAAGVYLTRLATGYSRLVDADPSVIIPKFNGVFYMMFTSSQLWGNLVSSLVLHSTTNTSAANTTTTHGDSSTVGNHTQTCGAVFCDLHHSSTVEESEPPQSLVYILLAAYGSSILMGVLVAMFGIDKQADAELQDVAGDRSLTQSILATCKKHADPCVLLLLMLYIYNGLEQGFLFGEFNQTYVGCELGVSGIGYTMIAFGAADGLGCLAVGALEKHTGRVLLFLIAAAINLSILIFLRGWDPAAGPGFVFYLVPGLWGLADAIWQTTTGSLLGSEFGQDEAVWATYRLWQSLGLCVGFVTARFLCVWIKIYLMLGALITAMTCYIGMEVYSRKRKHVWFDIQRRHSSI